MTQTPQPYRPPGRPRDPAKVEAILDTSWRLFLARGVEGCHRRHDRGRGRRRQDDGLCLLPDKRALFQWKAFVARWRKSRLRRPLPPATSTSATLRDVLIAFGTGIMTFLTSTGAVDFYSGTGQASCGAMPSSRGCSTMLDQGALTAISTAILGEPPRPPFPHRRSARGGGTAGGMWQGMTNYQLMLGIDHAGVVASIPERVSAGVDRFLQAYALPADRARSECQRCGPMPVENGTPTK